jgi:enoyl-CoA hydratase/carnithine racemase
MTNPYFKITLKDAVACIGVTRLPETWSDWTPCVSLFHQAVESIAQNDKIRVVILQADSSEALAADLAAFAPGNNDTDHPGRTSSAVMGWPSLTAALDKLDRPVIGVFDGSVQGLGLELAMCCDVRIATSSTIFTLDHVAHGLIPWEGGTQRLSRIIGAGAALEMILLAEPVSAAEAYRLGLIHRLVDPAEALEAYAAELVQKMVRRSPLSMAYAKEAIKSGREMTLSQGLRLEADLYFLIHTSDDRREGIQAFLAKRPPEFTGH